MTSISHTIAYFAKRSRASKVILLGGDLALNGLLPPWISVESRLPGDSLAPDALDFSGTLVAAMNGAADCPAPGLSALLNKASESARLVLSFDPRCVLSSPDGNWRPAEGFEFPRLFGLDLGYSLYDPRLPAEIPENPDVKVKPIFAVFNEADIIAASIEAALARGCEPIVIDNWSTDGTWETLQTYAAAGQIALERFPADGPSAEYDWRKLLARKEEVAAEHPDCWIFHQDADEVRDGPFSDLTFKQNIWLADHYGANALDFTVLNFRPIDNAWAEGKDLAAVFSHFEMGESRDDYTRQIKGWRSDGTRVSLAEQAGHEVRFRGRSVLPYKFIIRHYPLRSDEHARRKLYNDRIPRFSKAERALGWHTHYDAMANEKSFLWDAAKLLSIESPPPAFGSSLATGLPQSSEDDATTVALSQARVWLPYEVWIVIDLSVDPVAAFGSRIALGECLTLLVSCFEKVRALATTQEGVEFASARGVSAEKLTMNTFVDSGASPTTTAIAVAARLKQISPSFVFGVENGGSLSKAIALKSQGLAFGDTWFVTVLAGGTQRRLRAEGSDLRTPVHFETDYLEMLSATRADECLTADPGIAREWAQRGVHPRHITVAPIPSSQSARKSKNASGARPRINYVLIFGPQAGVDWEDLSRSLRAIDAAAPGIPLSVAGPTGSLFGEQARGYLVRTSKEQGVVFDLIGDPPIEQVLEAFSPDGTLVLLPRCGGAEGSALQAFTGAGYSVAVVGSSDGMCWSQLGQAYFAADERDSLSRLAVGFLRSGMEAATGGSKPLHADDLTDWENWASGLPGRHATMRRLPDDGPTSASQPLVSIVIPHFNRVALLTECVSGFLRQSYSRIEIIVVDDGSTREEDKAGLRAVEELLKASGGRVVWQSNAYLGAARNAGAAVAKGEYVLFFDDDDIPVPTMVETMVRAARTRDADVVSGNIFFWYEDDLENAYQNMLVSSSFVGACLELAYWRNPFGGAAVLVKRKSFTAIGGYTTDYGIGWEDYEFSVRICLRGLKYENIPLALYLYRINSAGMAATTPLRANGQRIWRTLASAGTHPAMHAVLRAGFMHRLWLEEQESKWSWLHTLGDRTALFHRLMKLPYNSREANELLVQIARSENHDDMADRLDRNLLQGKWSPLRRAVANASPAAPRMKPDEVLRIAKSLSAMGLVTDAIALIEPTIADGSASWESRLALARLYIIERQPDRAAKLATALLREMPGEPEVVMALYAAAEELSDQHTLGVLENVLIDSATARLLEDHPELTGISDDPSRLLSYWANELSDKGTRLVDFKWFPDGVTPLVLQRFRGWFYPRIDRVRFCVPEESYGGVSHDNTGLGLHPPTAGLISKAIIQLDADIWISAVDADGAIRDVRAPSHVEVALIPLRVGTEVDAHLGMSASADESLFSLLGVDPVWGTVAPNGEGNRVYAEFPNPILANSILVMSRVQSGSDNRYAQLHLKSIRLRTI